MALVAESELRPIYLLTGGDRPKIRRALERLRSRFGPESVEKLSAELVGGDEAVAALNSLGLFAGEGGRLVIVEEVDRWKKADEEAVAGYLADPVQGAVLALVAAELKGSALPALCANAGEVLAYDVPKPSELPDLGARPVRAPRRSGGRRGRSRSHRDRRRGRQRPRDRGREASCLVRRRADRPP